MFRFLFLFVFSSVFFSAEAQSAFVKQKNGQFVLDGKPYYYIGTNYWYGSVLPLQKDKARGIERLRKELDFLKSKGVTNLRVLGGAEGVGLVNGVERVGPSLQPEKGKFNEEILYGLDVLLAEMQKRNMKAVVFFSNNWEWSGGFLQYLQWNDQIPDSVFRRKMQWDELRDYVSKFYQCEPCKQDYLNHVNFILNHTNQVTGKKYSQDPTIMSWELANEPRPMRPASNEEYSKWISDVASFIKSKDKNHLLTTGHEGEIATESIDLFEKVHADKNIDYLTIHIWPRNWGWYDEKNVANEFPGVVARTKDYIVRHATVAEKLRKPLVLEEFGFTRDNTSFDPSSSTTFRDKYYDAFFSEWKNSAAANGVIAGANFWAFNGMARPTKGQIFWKAGDDYMGDPPMEEQGLYGVFDSDASTWQLISSYTNWLKQQKK